MNERVINIDGGELYGNDDLDQVINEAERGKYKVSYVIHYTIDLSRLKFLTYQQAQIRYSMGESKFRDFVDRADAICKVDRKVYADAEMLDEFMGTFNAKRIK